MAGERHGNGMLCVNPPLEEHESDCEGMGEQQQRAERKRKLPTPKVFKYHHKTPPCLSLSATFTDT
jgi:hypothetical protein